MRVLAVDTENTTWNKGNPFDVRNFNVCLSYAYREGDNIVTGVAWPENRADFERLFEAAELIVGFNLKYDLHWLKKLGFCLGQRRVYDCQVAEYVYTRQSTAYPSLDDTAFARLGERKIDVIKTEYWDKDINTHEIPRDVLGEYAQWDAVLTYRLFEFYQEAIPVHKRKLVNIRMADLVGLQEMEWNGITFDRDKINQRSEEVEKEIAEVRKTLDLKHNIPSFNWSSPIHISALLYGGTIKETVKVPDGIYKSGQKAGEIRYRNETREHHLPRLYKPIAGSESTRPGVWSVDEKYLTRLKGGGDMLKGILRIKKLQKLNSTYLRGMLEKYNTQHWTDDTMHGNFNQTVTDTTRLSSSNPNLQNIASDIKDIFRSRYV